MNLVIDYKLTFTGTAARVVAIASFEECLDTRAASEQFEACILGEKMSAKWRRWRSDCSILCKRVDWL